MVRQVAMSITFALDALIKFPNTDGSEILRTSESVWPTP
jgi:hypothetical protein